MKNSQIWINHICSLQDAQQAFTLKMETNLINVHMYKDENILKTNWKTKTMNYSEILIRLTSDLLYRKWKLVGSGKLYSKYWKNEISIDSNLVSNKIKI